VLLTLGGNILNWGLCVWCCFTGMVVSRCSWGLQGCCRHSCSGGWR
jgi:hypothetical protein